MRLSFLLTAAGQCRIFTGLPFGPLVEDTDSNHNIRWGTGGSQQLIGVLT